MCFRPWLRSGSTSATCWWRPWRKTATSAAWLKRSSRWRWSKSRRTGWLTWPPWWSACRRRWGAERVPSENYSPYYPSNNKNYVTVRLCKQANKYFSWYFILCIIHTDVSVNKKRSFSLCCSNYKIPRQNIDGVTSEKLRNLKGKLPCVVLVFINLSLSQSSICYFLIRTMKT